MGLFFEKGDSFYDSLDYQNALEIYNSEIHNNPKGPLGFILKGNCLFNLGREEEALSSYNSALKLEPKCLGAIYNIGYIEYTSYKNYSKALEKFNEAADICKDNKEYFFNLCYAKALCNFFLKNYDVALKLLEKCNGLKKGKDYLIVNNIGRCYARLQNHKKAIEYFRKSFSMSEEKFYVALYNEGESSLKIPKKGFDGYKLFDTIISDHNKEFAPAYYGLGKYYELISDRKQAIEYFNKSLSYDPNNPDAHLRKGDCYFHLKRYSEAIECFDSVILKWPEFKLGLAFYNKGNSLQAINRIEDAIGCYNQAIAYNSNNTDYYIKLAFCLKMAKKLDPALSAVEKSLEIKESWKGFYIKGLILYDMRSLKEAVVFFNKSQEIETDLSFISYKKALAYYDLGDYINALSNIERAIEKYDPKKKSILEHADMSNFEYYHGRILQKLDRDDEALICINKALEINPKFSGCYYERGAIYLKMKKYEKCLEYLEQANKLEKNNIAVYYKKGECLYKMGHYENAIKEIERAIELDYKDGRNYYLKGLCLFYLRRKNDAMYSFEKAILYKSFRFESYYYKGRILYELNIFNESKDCLESSMKCLINRHKANVPPDVEDYFRKTSVENFSQDEKTILSEIFLELGLLYKSENKFGDSIHRFDLSIRFNKENTSAYYNKAKVYMSLNNNEEALNYLNKALIYSPDSAKINLQAGNICYKLDMIDKAINYYDRASILDSYDPFSICNKGRCFSIQGKFKKAIECYDKSLQLDPHFETALYFKMLALFDTEEYEKAIKVGKNVLRVNPKKIDCIYYIGLCYEKLNKIDEAIQAFDECIENNKNYYKGYYQKAVVYYEMLKYDLAIETCQKALSINPNYYEANSLIEKCEEKKNGGSLIERAFGLFG